MPSRYHLPDAGQSQRQLDDFVSWLKQHPGTRISPCLQIEGSSASGARGRLVPSSDLNDGDEIFAIPRDLVLMVQNSQLNRHISQKLDELGTWLSLILVMIHEFLQGDKSPWAPYFSVLPSTFDTLMFWSESELSELQASAILNQIGKADAEKSIVDMVVPIVHVHPEFFPPTNAGVSSFEGENGVKKLIELAHRMGSLIMAYGFDIEKTDEDGEGEDGYVTDEEEQLPKGMIPLADFLNGDAHRCNVRLFQEDTFLVMRAIKPISAGDELFIDYGELPRAEILRKYGHVPESYTQYDVAEVPLALLCRAAGLGSSNPDEQTPLKFLDDLEILEDGYCIPRPSAEDKLTDILPDELLALLKTLTLSPEQLAKYQSKNRPPSPSLGSAEAQLLLEAVQARLAEYPTTLQQDEALLADLPRISESSSEDRSSYRRRMAIEVRLGEKQVLHRIRDMISAFISSLDGASSNKRPASSDLNGQTTKAIKIQDS
ncbi:hypothetical protein VTN49DRAFT_3658 [Thermomyces lanuginosus]|uniref:uncharacterized protein n=1 Tax=Thermomyces lanuginosus TaxID=5541 RepID=UPI0037444AFC